MKKVLVALDGSARAEGVLAAAVELALPPHAKLVLFRSFIVDPDLTLAWPMSDRPLENKLRGEIESYLGERMQAVPTDLVTETKTAMGEPWRMVCETARDEEVDLIVIGSHGYRGLDRILGTTASKIVNHTDRSVLVVR